VWVHGTMTFSRPVVLVTGASSGIGRAVVLRAAAQGAHVVLVARGRAALEAAARDSETAGAASTTVLPADVGDDDAVAELVASAVRRHGRLDVVVSNAGVVSYGRAEEVPAEVFDGVVRTNLTGAANLTRHVLPVLRRQEEGTLMFVGSVIGHVAVPSLTAYTVSKWGLRALVHQLRLENRDVPGVHIGYVAPAGVDTPIYRTAANYDGYVGRPPPPVASADRVARQILAGRPPAARRAAQPGQPRGEVRLQRAAAGVLPDRGAAVLPAHGRSRTPPRGHVGQRPDEPLGGRPRPRHGCAGVAPGLPRAERARAAGRWRPVSPTYDAIVVGAGPNGLVAANLLVDAGWSVLVLEAQPKVGGAVASDREVHPEFVHDTFSAFYPLAAASRTIGSFGLDRFGLEWTHAPAVLGHCLPSGEWAVLHRDRDVTAGLMDAQHPGDGDAWLELCGQWDRIGDSLVQALLTPPPRCGPGSRRWAGCGPSVVSASCASC